MFDTVLNGLHGVQGEIKDINRSREENKKIEPASIKNCMEPMLLISLCIVSQIENARKLEKATDGSVENWFKNLLRTAPRDLEERVLSAADSVAYKVCKEDSQGATLTFVLDVIKALERNNASDVVKDKQRCKGLINKLVFKLESAELKEIIKDAQECWSGDEKSCISFFQERVSALETDVAQGELARARLKRKHPARRPDEGNTRKPLDTYKGNRFKGKRPDTAEDKNHIRPKSKRFKHKCLNPDCNDFYLIKDCKLTSEGRKKELLDEFYKNKKSVKAVSKIPDHIRNGSGGPDDNEGRYKAAMEDCVNVTALGDYGSDKSVFSSTLLPSLIRGALHVKITKLSQPMVFKTAIANTLEQEIDFTASRKVTLAVTVYLPGSNISVRIRGVEFIVADQDMDEILLGRPSLKAVGFDLREHLLRVHKMVHDKHIDDLQHTKLTIAAVSYKGLAYQDTDDDPIALPDVVGAGIGKDSKTEIDLAFQQILKDAKAHGLSEKVVSRLEFFLIEYHNVFRIKLGPDEPASVPPLAVSLQPDSRSHRSPQRRYSPEQRAFLIRAVRELEAVGAIYKNPSAR